MTMTYIDGVTKTLREAKSLLEQHGWIQGRFGDIHAGFCSLGAVRAAAGDNISLSMGARVELYRALDQMRLDETYSLTDWNDATGRTKDEVLVLFDRTIKRLEKEAAAK